MESPKLQFVNWLCSDGFVGSVGPWEVTGGSSVVTGGASEVTGGSSVGVTEASVGITGQLEASAPNSKEISSMAT